MIELNHLQKVKGGTTLIQIEHLEVPDGDIAAVIGQPGSGIATLWRLLIARDVPTAGGIDLAGAPPIDRDAFSTSVGVLFAENALYARRSPVQHLTFECRLRGLDPVAIDGILKEVGLSDHPDEIVDRLSPSLQRRLSLARALLHGPTVLLLNTPFAGCDAATVDLLSRAIRRRASQGASVLALSQDPQYLLPLCSELHTLEHGEITETIRPSEGMASELPFKIPVRLEDEILLVNPGDILFATARDGRCWLRLTNRDLPTQYTLTEIGERLDRRGFFRAHRSYLVNLQHVGSVIPYTRNAYTLVLDDEGGTQIPLSRSAAAELRELLGY